MANWQGWVAAVAGLLVLLGAVGVPVLPTLNWLWGLAAIVFGVWGALAK